MNRRKSLGLLSALVTLVTACGSMTQPIEFDGVTSVKGDSGSVAESSASTSGSGGATTTSGAGGDLIDGGGMCNPPPPPSPTLPDQAGCYVDMGSGWVATPCLCDLWLANTTPAPITAAIQLVMTPADQVPTFTGPLDAEITFDDADGSAFAIWTKQAGNGTAFTVTNEGGTTTVKMGESSISLAPVPVAACKTRKANAELTGSNYMAALGIHAVLDDGSAPIDSKCSNPPPEK